MLFPFVIFVLHHFYTNLYMFAFLLHLFLGLSSSGKFSSKISNIFCAEDVSAAIFLYISAHSLDCCPIASATFCPLNVIVFFEIYILLSCHCNCSFFHCRTFSSLFFLIIYFSIIYFILCSFRSVRRLCLCYYDFFP